MSPTNPFAAGLKRILTFACDCGTEDDITQNQTTGTWTCGNCRSNAHADAVERTA